MMKQNLSTTFEAAKQKLSSATEPFPLTELPKLIHDPLWTDLKNQYNLTLAEVSSLKNHIVDQTEIPTSTVDVLQLLEGAKHGPLDISEIEYAFLDHLKIIDLIVATRDENEQARLATMLWNRLKLRVKTKTQRNMPQHYLFKGSLHDAQVRQNTELQYVLRGSSIFCCKIMSDVEALQREATILKKVHENQVCPTVMPLIDFFELPCADFATKRACMITPLYSRALADFEDGSLHEEAVINAALCSLASIKALWNKHVCHGDIKPANMMLSWSSVNGMVTIIDFGSAVAYGQELTSISPDYALDHSLHGCLSFDLTCLAASIYVLATGETLPYTRKSLCKMLDAHIRHDRWIRPSLKIARLLLDSQKIDKIWEKSTQYVETALEMDRYLDRSLIVPIEMIWPVYHGNKENMGLLSSAIQQTVCT